MFPIYDSSALWADCDTIYVVFLHSVRCLIEKWIVLTPHSYKSVCCWGHVKQGLVVL